MRYGSVCSGVEAASLAWESLGWQPAWFAEIEPFPAAVLDHHWPHVQNHGDMTQLEARILSGEIEAPDILVGGTPCFTAGHMVLTEHGYKPIENIVPGDLVVTHKGRLKPVVRIGSKPAEVGALKAVGLPDGIICTADHPFLSQKWISRWIKRNGKHYKETTITPPEWTPASEMAGNQWVSLSGFDLAEKNNLHSIFSDDEVMRLAGFYLGDGWIRRWTGKNKKVVIFGLNAKKYEQFRQFFPSINHSASKEKTVIKVSVCNTELAEFLSAEFGEKAYGKRIPAWVLNHPDRQNLLNGYMLTDGSKSSNGFTANSVSKALAYGVAGLAQTLGYVASVAKVATNPTTIIDGRVVNQRDYYQMRAFLQIVSRKSRQDENRILRAVSKFEIVGSDTVFNIEVADDNSYIVENAVVHNCQAFSVAGLRNSLADDRGNLTLVLVRILNAIDEIRERLGKPPAILVWENVPGVLSTKDNAFGSFLAGLAGEELPLEPAGKKWTNAGAVFNHQRQIAWRTLNAEFFGVPQSRRRVFLVASARNVCPSEILFEHQGSEGDYVQGMEAKQNHSGAAARSNGSHHQPILMRMRAFGDYLPSPTASTLKARDYKDATDLIVIHGRQDPCISDKAFALDCQHSGNTNVFFINSNIINKSPSSGGNGLGIRENGIAYTLTATDRHAVAMSRVLRRFTPVECERLQGMPDNHTRIPWRGKPAEACPDGPRYKAIGNSMAVPVMRWIGDRITQFTNPDGKE